ncbi:MAG: TonB-dependent receptor [Bacteroidales bacterium]|nr:TonB-dependent receptor [Bacteroidales bacterium]
MRRQIIFTLMLSSCISLVSARENKGNVTDTLGTRLQELVVKAPLIRREADRIVVNVAADPLSANKNARDLLKTAPGVWATDDMLSIYGQSGVSVYIDDRKVNMSGSQLMKYLGTIRSASIATIEIIPQAGAEYSADAAGGVIIIKLRRKRIEGLDGSAGLGVTAGEYKGWINPFINLGMHTGRWTVSFNGSLNGTPSDRYTSHEETGNTALSQEMRGSTHGDEKTLQENISLGIFYELTERDKTGLQFDYNPSQTNRHTISSTETSGQNFIGNTTGSYHNRERFHNFNVAFNWLHDVDDKGSVLKLISNYTYQKQRMDEVNLMSWSYLPEDSAYRTDNGNRYNVFTTDLSFLKVFHPNWNINVGGKYTLNDVSNNSYHQLLEEDRWCANPRFDYATSYDENIIALYASVNGGAGRWKFKAGLRGEYTLCRGEEADYRRFDFFPNANISYSLTERGDYSVSIGYGRNIRRPSFQSLNPVVRQVADYTYTVGNINLKPSFTDRISVDFLLAGRYTVVTGYSITDKPIRQMFVSNPDYPERLYLTWDNESKDRNFFIHGDGFISLTEWWNMYTSVTYMVTSQKISDTASYDTFGYLQFIASTGFFLPKGLNISVSCFYNTRMKIGNITIYPILNIEPTIQKDFGKHWSVSVSAEDMLQRRSKIRTESAGYKRFTSTKSHMAVRVGVTYKFNSGKAFRTTRIEKNMDNSRFSK